MSGGSYDYLYSKEDLLGHGSDLRNMADSCEKYAICTYEYWLGGPERRQLNHEERLALKACASFLRYKADYLRLLEEDLNKLRPLLKSVEWTDSCDSGPDDIIAAFRALMELK